jgi:ubiquinone/menaquinone biosynthesis C-methylase UbiE
MAEYIHGYSDTESQRLRDQGQTLEQMLHAGVRFPKGATVLEAGCGVGCQTVTLAQNSPGAQFVSIDQSAESVDEARQAVEAAGLTNVTLQQADVYDLPFDDSQFDHIFVCWVLEHLPKPVVALKALKRLLKKDGTITVIEGDHASCFFRPKSKAAQKLWDCLIAMEKQGGADPTIGRFLSPLLRTAGFADIAISPLVVYADHNTPELMTGFVEKAMIEMMAGMRDKALDGQFTNQEEWDRGMADFHKILSEPAGAFSLTIYKATAMQV